MEKYIPRILVVSPNPTEVSSFYRGVGPIAELEKKGVCKTMVTRDCNWNSYTHSDILFLLRPMMPVQAQIAREAKELGLKIWVDHDDDVFNLPTSHDMWEDTKNEINQRCMNECLDLADRITVTTESLKRAIVSRGVKEDKIVVIKNAINDNIFKEPEKPCNYPKSIILWRGGNTHEYDVATISKDLEQVYKNYNYRFVFMGYRPRCVYKELPLTAFTYIRWNAIISDYIKQMKFFNAPIQMIPLDSNSLNISKSNISWIEGTWFGGSTCIVSDIDNGEWEKCYKFRNNFVEKIGEMINDTEQRLSLWEQSVALIKEKYVLSKTNLQRASLISELMNG